MAELKPGWRMVKFGDVVRQVKDKVVPADSGLDRFIAGEHMDTDDLRLRRWGQISEDYLGPAFHMRFKPGQVLYGSRRTYLRKVAVTGFEGICANTTFVLESKDSSVLLPELLPFVMSTEAFHDHSIKQSKGSVNPYVNFSDLAWYEFALPPLEGQRSIANVFRSSESVVEAYRTSCESAQALELSLIDSIVQNWIDRGESTAIAQVLASSPESGCSAPPVTSETGHFVLALSALERGGYISGQLKPVSPTEGMLKAVLEDGDLLISRSNTLERVGFVGVYRREGTNRVSFPDTMMRLSPQKGRLKKDVLEMVLQSSPLRREIMSIAAGTSASMKKINKTNLMKLLVPTPPPSEQDAGIECREKAREVFQLSRSRLHASLQQRAALVNSIFRG